MGSVPTTPPASALLAGENPDDPLPRGVECSSPSIEPLYTVG